MEREYRRSPAARAGLFCLMTVAALAACGTAVGQRFGGGTANQVCYRDESFGGNRGSGLEREDAQRLAQIGIDCSGAANAANATRRQTIYANFYAGKAYRLAGQQHYQAAEAALRDVTSFNGQRAGPRARPEDLRFELIRIAADVELARLYRAQPGRKDEAARSASAAIARYQDYSGNSGFTLYKNEALDGRVDATMLMVDIQRSMPPPNQLLALEALHALYPDPALERHPKAADVYIDLRRTAILLGEAQLREGTEEGLTNAGSYFEVARKAADSLKKRDPAFDVSDVFIYRGRVHMARGGLRSPLDPNGCTGATVNVAQIQNALDEFKQAGSSDAALLWKGCAQLGLNQLNDALASFGAATQNNPFTQLALGRAYFRQADQAPRGSPLSGGNLQAWDSSREAYRTAIDQLKLAGDGAVALLTQAHIERADVNLALARRSSGDRQLTAIRQARADFSSAAVKLRAARELNQTQAWAFLRLAEMQIGDDFFRDEGARYADARENIKVVLQRTTGPGQRDVLAHGSYLTSKLEERLGNVGKAVESADNAADIGGAERTGLYYAQACDVRMRANARNRNYRMVKGEQYCKANDGRNQLNLGEALLREGVYYLLTGTNAVTRTGQSEAWDSAYKAFERGVGLQLANLGQTENANELRARLLAGKGLAMICSGLSSVGENIIGNEISAELRSDARGYFGNYGIRC